MSTEVRKLTKNGVQFYPQTHIDAIVGDNGDFIDERPISGSTNLAESGGIFDEIVMNSGAFDLTAYNSGATYANLSAALTAMNSSALAPYRKGGMSIRFVQTSDNKYVQYRLMHDLSDASTAAADFANINNWQGVSVDGTDFNNPSESKKAQIASVGAVYDAYGVPSNEIKEVYLPTGTLTDEQLDSVKTIRITNISSSLSGHRTIAFYFRNGSLENIYNILLTLPQDDVALFFKSGILYTPKGAVAFDNLADNEAFPVDCDVRLTNEVFNIDTKPLLKQYFDSLSLGSKEERITPEVTSGYRRVNGGIGVTNDYVHSTTPIYLKRGESVFVYTSISTNVAVFYKTDRVGNWIETIQAGIHTGSYCYSYTAKDDIWLGLSYKAEGSQVTVIKCNSVTNLCKLDWIDKHFISNTGIRYNNPGVLFGISKPVEVFAGDILEITAIGSTGTSLFSKSRYNGYGVYDMWAGDDVLEPLLVAPDTTQRKYTYTVDEHCYIVVCANIGNSRPDLYITRERKVQETVDTINDYEKTKYGEQKHLYVDEYQFIPNTDKRGYNKIITYSADNKNGNGTAISSNFIVNAVAYPNGEIIACRNGGAVVKIMNDGTEIPIQYSGADMVIQNASDWRGVFISKDLDVFISPHSSIGRGDNGQINEADRGLYRIAYGSIVAEKVLSLFNNAPVMVVLWAENTVYTVGDVVWYINHCYKCTTAHTSGSSFDASKFERMPNWAKNTAYSVGDIVQHDNNDFECIEAHTSGSSWDSTEQNYWVAAASCMSGQLDTIWSMCEDDRGVVYAGVYAHLTRRQPVIYASYDRGIHWRYIYNFATNAGVDIPDDKLIIQGPRHIHGITFNEYDNCLYCACGETNTLWKSSDYGYTWEDLKCSGYEGKPTSVIGVPDGVIMGSDGQWGCAITKILTDGKTAKLTGRFWASFIFNIRRSDLTGWLYAFSRLDNVIQNKGNGQPCPPVEAMTDPAALQAWKESVTNGQLGHWLEHHDFCEKYYPDDAIIPHHAAIMVSKDNGDSWEILRYEDVGTNGNSGFTTVGYFRNGECLTGLVTDDGRASGNIYVKPIVITEGKKKTSFGVYDLTGDIFIKTNKKNWVGGDNPEFLKFGDINVCDGNYTDNPNYIEAKEDANGRILEGIDKNGNKILGAGLKVNGNASIGGSLDIGNDVHAKSVHADTELEVAGNIVKQVDNPDFLSAWVDNKDRLILAIRKDGKVYFGAGVPSEIAEYISNIAGKIVQNESWGFAFVDDNNRVVFGIRSNGEIEWGVGVPTAIKNYLAQYMNFDKAYITTTIGTGIYPFRSEDGSKKNVVVGYENFFRLESTNDCFDNTAVGYHALFGSRNAKQNTAVGSEALDRVGGERNTAFGYYAGGTRNDNDPAFYETLEDVTAIGTQALQFNRGNRNTAVGSQALIGLHDGDNNLAIGFKAGAYVDSEQVVDSQHPYNPNYQYEDIENTFYLDNLDRGSKADMDAKSMMVGKFAADIANQWLKINGKFAINGNTPQGKTTVSADATDLTSAITLLNELKNILKNFGLIN